MELDYLFAGCLPPIAEGLVQALDGQAHHVEVAALDAFYGYHTYPFLYAVGACFVQWAVVGDVVGDFGFGEWGEGDAGGGCEGLLLGFGQILLEVGQFSRNG